MTTSFRLRILGSFEALYDDRPVGPGPEATKPRALLATLAMQPNVVVSKDSLIDHLWIEPPPTARNLIEKYVSQWRKVLDPERIQTVGAGYRLRLSPRESELDALRALLADGIRLDKSGDHAGAAAVFAEAFDMWRTTDIDDFARRLLPSSEAQHLTDLYLRTLELWANQSLIVGAGAAVTEPLHAARLRNPYRERLAELLMWSYYQQDRQSEALATYEQVRRTLDDELGHDPSASLQRLHARVLRQDPSLAGSAQSRVDVITKLPRRIGRFSGRELEISALRGVLDEQDGAAGPRAVAVWGPVGIGKTALAVALAERYKDQYRIVWLVNSTSKTAAADDLEALANRLGIEFASDRETSFHLLWHRLRESGHWLLIFDNAGRPEDVMEYWPAAAGGDVVVTSLNPDWGQLAKSVELSVLAPAETVALLEERTGRPHDFALEQLAAELDGLPLACEQAAAYVRQTGMTTSEYLGLFRRRRMQLMDRGAPGDHVGTVATTWRLALAELSAESPGAVELVLLCAHLAAENIPLALLRTSADQLPSDLRAAAIDDVGLEDLIGEVRRYSLLSRQGDHVRMHRLIQAVVADSLSVEDSLTWRIRAAELVAAGSPGHTTRPTWSTWQSLVPHATHVTARLNDPTEWAGTVGVLRQTAEYLVARGSFDDAAELLTRAHTLLTGAATADDARIGETLTELGEVLERKGEVDLAVSRLEDALDVLQRRRPPDTVWVARASAGLAAALTCHSGVTKWRTEALPEVEERFGRALSTLRSALGPEHPAVSRALSGLGQILQDRGDVEGGVRCQRQALAISLRCFGPDHSDVGHLHDKLGYGLGLLGQFDAAKASHLRALEILEHVYGEGHPETGWPQSNLGVLFLRAGEVDQSVECQQRALRVFSQSFGDVVATNIVAWRLAQSELAGGETDRARTRLRDAHGRLEAQLGPRHPDVTLAAADLARAEELA